MEPRPPGPPPLEPPTMPSPAAQPQPPDPTHCPRCGAPHDLHQEYCLECGARLPPPFGVRREIWSRESPLWLWAALAALLLVALVAGAIVAVAATGDEEATVGRRTVPVLPTGPGTTGATGVIPGQGTITIQPPATTVLPTTGTVTLPTTTAPTGTTATTTTTPASGTVTWPAGKDGFTVVLRSVPTSEGRGEADSAARTARNNGLPQVGVLNSSDFSSLRPGFFVTFSGIYDTEAQAVAALPTARSKGFPVAYPREVSN